MQPINSPPVMADPAADLEFLRQSLKPEENQVTKKLALHLEKVWQKNQQDFNAVRKDMLKSLRRVKGEYEPDKLTSIRAFKGTEAFFRASENKARAAESWIKDIYLTSPDFPFNLEPTAIPDLPDETIEQITAATQEQAMMLEQQMIDAGLPVDKFQVSKLINDYYQEQLDKGKTDLEKEAKERCERAAKLIRDQNQEGGWNNAFKDFLYYFVRLKFGIIKGPILTKRPKTFWKSNELSGTYELVTEDVLANDVYAVSPWYFFPAKGMRHINDGDCIELHELSKQSLSDLIGVPGYSEVEIRAVLDKFEKGDMKSKWFTIDDETEVKQLTKDKNYSNLTTPPTSNASSGDSENIFAQEFYGTVSGAMLIEWGMTEPLDPNKQYQANCWKIGDHVIKAVINPDALGRKPYHISSWAKNPEWIVGEGLVEFAAPVEDAMNAVGRALINNVAIACLTGDTVVIREGQYKKVAHVTIKELFDKKQLHNSGLRRIKLRSLNEGTGEFFGNRIVDVVDNGIAEVFEVTTERGYKIKATGNHRFMNADGEWQFLDNFDCGDLIAVNGQKQRHLCSDCEKEVTRAGVRCSSCASKPKNNSWNAKQVEMARDNRGASDTTARMRYECRIAKKDFCEDCGGNVSDGLKLEVHHKDKCPWNNSPENLMTLCHKCHPKRHAYEDSFGDAYLHRYVSFDQIVSIVSLGEQQVYDLCMTGPNHNFIANGFVSHNSGPMCEIDKDRVDNKVPIYPWRQIESTSMQMKTEGPAVVYYQPNMHANELTLTWSFFSKVLDEMTVPAYAQGASQSGVTAGTATVFTQLLAAASRSIKAVVANIDDDIIVPYNQMCYDYNMKFDEDQTAKGDARIVAKGVSGLQAKEQAAQRKVEYLQIIANPTYQQILGPKNIGSLLAQIAKSNDLQLPDLARLDGDENTEAIISAMLSAQAGIDPMQDNGQVAAGGGAPSKAQGLNADNSKAGVTLE